MYQKGEVPDGEMARLWEALDRAVAIRTGLSTEWTKSEAPSKDRKPVVIGKAIEPNGHTNGMDSNGNFDEKPELFEKG